MNLDNQKETMGFPQSATTPRVGRSRRKGNGHWPNQETFHNYLRDSVQVEYFLEALNEDCKIMEKIFINVFHFRKNGKNIRENTGYWRKLQKKKKISVLLAYNNISKFHELHFKVDKTLIA